MSKELEERFTSMVAKSRRVLTASVADGLSRICIGMATCGPAAGAAETKAAFEETLAEHHLAALLSPSPLIRVDGSNSLEREYQHEKRVQ
jgi:hypothetical protein